jgi:hydrogenase expression/formation protein HypE
MHDLLENDIVNRIGIRGILTDSAILDVDNNKKIAYTTDSFVVSPLFFPGGNIGDLAVNGTVNDLSMVGAVPRFITSSFIIEEGFEMESLRKITESMAIAAKVAHVKIVTGDTKVVNRGKGDGIFINTSGIGLIDKGIDIHPSNIKAGDIIIVNSSIGRHGISVMSERNGLSFDPPVLSDSAPLNGLVEHMLSVTDQIHTMRDPTRGGLATTLKEIALDTGFGISINEKDIAVDSGVRGACELLGLDPLYVANEGLLVAFVEKNVAEFLLEQMKKHPLGKQSIIIGEVLDDRSSKVFLKTEIGGSRILDLLTGEQLPRIC